MERKNDFLKGLQVDSESLLDPSVCRGDNFIPNILKYLGVNETITKNPEAIKWLRLQIMQIASQHNLELPNMFEEPTREQINNIVNAIKSDKVLTPEERQKVVRQERSLETKQKSYHGINIDEKTGNVTIGGFNFIGYHLMGNNSYYEAEYTASQNGNLIITHQSGDITNNLIKPEVLIGEGKTVLNRDGIDIEKEVKLYKQDKEDKTTLKYHATHTRDKEYPFVEEYECLLNEDIIDSRNLEGKNYVVLDTFDHKDSRPLGCFEFSRDEKRCNFIGYSYTF